MSQVITINFAQGQTEAVADQPLTQWAYGQKLKFTGLTLPTAYQVDFSNWEFQGDSIQRIGNADGVAVPTEILTSGRNVYAFIWIADANSGRRRYMAMVRVVPGPAPDPEEPNPQESSEISEVLAELNAAVETAEDAAGRGPQIRNGYWYTWNAESQEYENTEVPSTGNKIWWTTADISTIPGNRYVVLLSNLNGPAEVSPAVLDLVVGPAPNTSGSATYLYYIYGIDTTLQQVILKGIGSIKGAQGDPGADGVSPSVSVSEITGGHQVLITDAQGTETFDVMNGEEGPAGPSGGQFWSTNSAYTTPSYTWAISSLTGPENGTPAIGDLVYYSTYRYTITSIDAENQTVTCTIRASIRGQQGPAGQGVPVGGDMAQILSKKSATDYDTQWSDLISLLPSTFKAALLQLAQKVAYIDDQGADYYQDLYDALYPPKELVSISAVFTQGQTVVYDTDSLDSLKTMLVVTGTYDDQSTETIPSTGYTLSGTLTAGTSTITVTCDGKTTTFTVQVTHQPGVYAVTNNLTGCSNSNSANSVTEGGSYSGTITASAGYMMTGATVSITMGGTDITGTAYSNGTISIDSVTGALIITVTAVAVTLSSISAVYTQSGTVYDTDSLDSLKDDLVVTATYSDSSTAIVPAADYTLSGTLTAGTSTITVSYGGKTTTFTVTVTAYWTFEWDYSQGKLEEQTGWHSSTSGTASSSLESTGERITANSGGYFQILPDDGHAVKTMTGGKGVVEVTFVGHFNTGITSAQNLRVSAAEDASNRMQTAIAGTKFRIMDNSTPGSMTSFADYVDGTEYTERIVLKGTAVDIYINGVLAKENASKTATTTGSTNYIMVQQPGSGYYVDLKSVKIRVGEA